MRIDRVEIHNIRSYREATMDFLRGVNLILGENGTGKSTIIECIGYCVFNSKPDDLKAFLRQGCKKAEVSVSFTLSGEKRYKSLRTLRRTGQNNTWQLFDLDCGEELDLQGERDICDFLKQEMGLSPSVNLSALFSEIIGANQNELTTPFLQSRREREKAFNRLLMVEDYEKAADRFRTGIRELEQEIELKRAAAEPRREYADLLSGECQRKQELEEEKATQEKAFNALEEEYAGLNQVYMEYQRAQRRQEEAKTRAVLVRQSMEQLQEHIDQQAQRLKRRKELGQRALELRPDHEAYERTQALQQEYQRAQRTFWQQEEQHTAHLREQNEQEAQQAGIQERIKQAEEERRVQADRLNAFRQEAEQADAFQEEQKSEYLRLQEQSQEEQQRLEEIRRMIKERTQWAQDFDVEIQRRNEQSVRIAQLEEELRAKQQTRKNIEALQQAETALQQERDRLSGLEEAIRIKKGQLQILRGNRCPFSGRDCSSVTQEDYLTLQQELQALKQHKGQSEHQLSSWICQVEAYSQSREAFYQVQEQLELHRKLEAEQQERENMLVCHQTQALTQEVLKEMEQTPWMKPALEEIAELLAETEKEKDLSAVQMLLKELEGALRRATDFLSFWERENENTLRGRAADIAQMEQQAQWAKEKLEEEQKKGEAIQKRLEQYRCTGVKLEENIACGREEIHRQEEQLVCQRKELESMAQSISLSDQLHKNALEYLAICRQLEELEEVPDQMEALSKQLCSKDAELQALEADRKAWEEVLLKTDEQELTTQRQKCEAQRQEAFGMLQRTEAQIEQAEKNIRLYEADAQAYAALCKEAEHLEGLLGAAKNVRQILKRSGQHIAAALREQICEQADALHRKICNRNARLEWGEDYELKLLDTFDGQKREIGFQQMSGGEKMSAAFCIRLAMMRVLCRVDMAFFDEPTANLDAQRRARLCDMIPAAAAGFEQMFFISHDDTFHNVTQNVVQLARGQDGTTRLLMD